MAAHKKSPTVTVTNPKASRLPRQLGTFASAPPKPEPIYAEPRARKGEKFKGATVTNPDATYTTKAKGGSA